MPGHDRRRLIRRTALVASAAAVLLMIACWPTTSQVGVNHVISTQTLPLWAKTVDFLRRDMNMSATAREVIGPHGDADARATAALAWTRGRVLLQPAALPIIDDHLWHIIVRGYGERDQLADVFTALLSYAGVPAYWTLVGQPPDELPLSFVWIRDQWRVYDVAHGIAFRNRQMDLATPAELAADPQLITAAAAAAHLDAARYAAYFTGFQPPVAPDVSRADLQMPRRRLWQEARRLIGMPGRESQLRQGRQAPAAEGPQR